MTPRLYIKFLHGLRGYLSVGRLIKFSIFVSLTASLAILLPDQSLEALRVAAEDAIAPGDDRTARTLALIFTGALFLCVMSWYWARILLYLNLPGWIKAHGGSFALSGS